MIDMGWLLIILSTLYTQPVGAFLTVNLRALVEVRLIIDYSHYVLSKKTYPKDLIFARVARVSSIE